MPLQQHRLVLRTLGLLLASAAAAAPAFADTTTVNFDDRTAPCTFASASSPAAFYTSVGLTLSGGFEVINFCGSFSVTAYSSPNFLAWNSGASTGLAETFIFTEPTTSVTMYVGSNTGGTATLVAYDSASAVLGSGSRTVTSTLGAVSVSASDIHHVTLTVTGTNGVVDDVTWTHSPALDGDGDGYPSTTDCDDTDAAIHPGATETCNDADDDCDGTVDEGAADASTWYADTDGDDFGDAASPLLACEMPSGYAGDDLDCDDTDGLINPDGLEICNGADDDCDGTVDLGADDPSTWYTDADGDSYGALATAVDACDAPSGTVTDGTDCDDTLAAINPGATEVCDSANTDEDCDGLADNADSSASGSTRTAFYADSDDDGYGSTSTASFCDLPADYSTLNTDCDDAVAAINPAATEISGDGVDQDCDGGESCYVDADFDGARTAFVIASPDAACSAPGEALGTADLDCDDTDPTAYPDATELTGSGVDEDCDGTELCYTDSDGDAYRPDTTSTIASSDGDCDDAGEALATALAGDCDDSSTAYNPAAVEDDCTDPNDYNCDGAVGYRNADGDAFAACAECDDSDASVFPGAAEAAGDGVDSDCDGVDVCYVDADDDGYRPDGTSTVSGSTVACDAPGEASDLDPLGDCDDGDFAVNPAATETLGDELDANCDGGESCFVDADVDGYRSEDGATVSSDDLDCSDDGEALATAGTDCDDTQASVNPAAAELAGDQVDSDCDDTEICYVDADADGYRPDESSTVASADVSCAEAGEALATAPTDDCDDTDATVSPDGVERVGDGIDSDCDGAEVCYADADADGYRGDDDATVASSDADCDDANEALATTLTGDCDTFDAAYNPAAVEDDCTDPNDYNCDGSVGYVDADGDGHAACAECNDGDATVFPGAVELAGDLLDQDCDGTETCYVDADDDGYRPDETSTVSSANVACDASGEAVATDPSDDCDDADAAVSPAAAEIVGDGIDQDCDGTESCFVDADADGYTAEGGAIVESADIACDGTGEAPADALSGDCDDASAAYNPGAAEDDCADPADYNCDGSSGYADADLDGFAACEECDDAVSGINPAADEVCNDLDDDCDGTVDVGAIDAGTWYADADGDGFTDPGATVTACDEPEGYLAATEDDCDDGDATSFPGGDELPDDGIDQDCDGEDAVSEDTDAPDDDTGVGKDDSKDGGECGCSSPDAGGAALSLVLAGLALTARRRRSV
ncbi:MAG: MopE-related protein [Pseudomonadota bacterium]|nr:MopE-related protein [Pseudomonadota bacterium]